MKRFLVVAVVLALAGAACGDTEGSATSAPPPSTAGAAGPATSAGGTAPPSTELPSISTTSPSTTAPELAAPASSTTAPATTTTLISADEVEVDFELFADGFDQPVFLDSPSGDPRQFVVEQPGVIWVLAPDGERGRFLDITDLVRFQGEQGLLGLAFHPDYASNGQFYIHYTDRSGDTRVVEYRVSENPDRADPDSSRVLLAVSQPAGNHNGGMLAFGPDGKLFVGLGDGGGANDQFGQGQDPATLLGTLLRLDVDAADPPGIPGDNPFVDGGGNPAVWAYGLRNPWRFSFDDGLLYIGDVGQNEWEEIDVVPAEAAGLNFGWPITEGTHCFRPSTDCDRTGLTLPVVEYSHGQGCSVTGGVVYRGTAVPGLDGHYLYADFCNGWVRSFRFEDGVAVPGIEWQGEIPGLTSFGTDAAGEVFALSSSGSIWRVVPG